MYLHQRWFFARDSDDLAGVKYVWVVNKGVDRLSEVVVLSVYVMTGLMNECGDAENQSQ